MKEYETSALPHVKIKLKAGAFSQDSFSLKMKSDILTESSDYPPESQHVSPHGDDQALLNLLLYLSSFTLFILIQFIFVIFPNIIFKLKLSKLQAL